MEQVTVSSKGQIAIPKRVRDLLNLCEGAKLVLSVRGQEIILSKDPPWRKLRGAGKDEDVTAAFADFRKRERESEDAGS